MRAVTLLTSIVVLLAAPAALALDCREAAERELQRLSVGADEIDDVRYIEKINPTERGPDVLGVRAWIRLAACDSGYMVIDMTRSCFVRQSYTRGSCQRDGVTAY